MKLIYKYNIHPSVKEVFPDVFKLVAKRVLLNLESGLVPTSNKDQVLDNLHNRMLVPEGKNYIITDFKGNPKGYLKENAANGYAFLYYNNADPNKATKVEAWATGSPYRDVCTANPCITIRETSQNGVEGYELHANDTLINGVKVAAAVKNEDFQELNTNWGLSSVNIAGQERDGVHWIGGRSFRGADKDNVITISRHETFKADYLFDESDAQDIDKEALIVQYQTGSGVGKGTFGIHTIDFKTNCPKLF